jgi:2,4-dienoyl-CoA reductase (NADPH2)
MANFSHLLSPLDLGKIKLKNRVVMGSMHTGLEDDKDYSKLASYFAARARGQVGLMVTGGFAPDVLGWLAPFSSKLTSKAEVAKHCKVTDAVHKEGSKIFLQILHAGRYGYHPFCVAPSAVRSPISRFSPWAMPKWLIQKTISNYVRCSVLAEQAGYDGIEIMGSEGYLINQFVASRTNKRTDEWGGSFNNRIRFPLSIVRSVLEKVSKNFVIMFRLSMLDLVEGGSSWQEVVDLGTGLEEAGVDIINTGIGWHEARVPTIAATIPRGAFSFVTKKIKEVIKVPLVCTNRINTPEVAENLLQEGHADLVSMARPLLADPEFVLKCKQLRSDEINTCIGCNQACLDYVFVGKKATCLVNPQACREQEFLETKAVKSKKIAVIGAGPTGLSFAATAAKRGHNVTLYDKNTDLGGQFNLASKIPGKQDFLETLRYYRKQLQINSVKVNLNKKVSIDDIVSEKFDEVVLATGVRPREIKIEGIDHPKVLGYTDVLAKQVSVGKNVAIIGAGGIGFDVASFLSHEHKDMLFDLDGYYDFWGIDKNFEHRAGIKSKFNSKVKCHRNIYLLQRKIGKFGQTLGKTTGWVHRQALLKYGVKMIGGVSYQKIDDKGLYYSKENKSEVLEVDNIIVCAGQESENELAYSLRGRNIKYHIIGGAFMAKELDAKYAIEEGYKLGVVI